MFCDRVWILIVFETIAYRTSSLGILNQGLGEPTELYEIIEWENPLEEVEGQNTINYASLKEMENFETKSAYVVAVDSPPKAAIIQTTLDGVDFAGTMDLKTSEVAFTLDLFALH